MTGTEVERVGTVGPPSAEGFVVGKVLSAEPHPNADRLRVCTVDTGDGERTIVCGAPNVAAGQTVPVALPGGDPARRSQDRQGEAARGRVGRDDLRLLRAGAGGGAAGDPRARGRRPRARHAAVRGAADRRAGAGAGGDPEPGRLLRRLRRRPRGPRDQRRAAGPEPWAEDAPAEGEGEVERLRLGHGRGAGPLPALHRPCLHRRHNRAPRRPGCRRGSPRPVSGRSTTSSTSPTT